MNRTAGLPRPEGCLVLERERIAGRVPGRAFAEAVRQAFRQLAERQFETPAVGHVPGSGGAFHIKTAARLAAPRRAVVKVNANFPDNDARRGLPVIQGFIALLDATNGKVLALMDSIEVTGRRTAATSVLAAQFLARRDSRTMALIGCGTQAGFHLDAFAETFAIGSLRLFDRELERAEELARVARAKGIEAEVRVSASSAARGCDIVVTTTPSRVPVLAADDVCGGSFIAAVGADSAGKQELEPALLLRGRVVPDLLKQALSMGDLQHAVAQSVMTSRDIHAELADIVSGRVTGRSNPDELFIFDSTGTAIADLACAELVFETLRSDPEVLRLSLSG